MTRMKKYVAAVSLAAAVAAVPATAQAFTSSEEPAKSTAEHKPVTTGEPKPGTTGEPRPWPLPEHVTEGTPMPKSTAPTTDAKPVPPLPTRAQVLKAAPQCRPWDKGDKKPPVIRNGFPKDGSVMVSWKVVRVQDRYVACGIYMGKRRPAHVKVFTDRGMVPARAVNLSKGAGWDGVFLTGALPLGPEGKDTKQLNTFLHGVHITDAAGRKIVSINLP
ncbi:hypothetical protein [Streptomyces palmae]|uniref:hypothetical protein n=1 Tax=Streptomyces palmae TaxID=1701085 RepID=UPI001FD7287C|nr:hypothetical protein [Streptomyces palmae]